MIGYPNLPHPSFSAALKSKPESTPIVLAGGIPNPSIMTTNLHLPITLLLTVLFCLPLATLAYTLPHQHFIKCGFTGTTTVNNRDFVGDQTKPAYFSLSGDRSTALKNPTPSDLYGTARVFRRTSSYELDISQNGTHVVRFHFSAFFSEEIDLYSARFNVSAANYYLLSDFAVERSSNGSGLVREFLFNVTVGHLRITFTPCSGSLAFVNAIEAFLAPEDMTRDYAARAIDPDGSSNVTGLWSRALQVIYRINVGGDELERGADGLRRIWESDDKYMSVPDAAVDTRVHCAPVLHSSLAPDSVYGTAKVLKNGSTNASWRFRVNRKSSFLVRAHFCDFITLNGSDKMTFNLFIFSLAQPVDTHYGIEATTYVPDIPFCLEYAVDSDDSGVLNISIGRRQGSDHKTAFLNGLEIMQLINSSSSLAADGNAPFKSHLYIIIGSAVGAAVLIIILVLLWSFCFRAGRKEKGAETLDLEEWQRLNTKRRGSSRSTKRNANGGSQLPHGLNLGLKMALGEVLFATKNFDEQLVIGRGGFGKVYRGVLMDGTKVAVKRSEPGQAQGLPEFQTEITVLSKIRHRHLVSLIGYCDESWEMVLVYEYMEKGTLRDHLYRPKEEYNGSGSHLSWEKRLELCIDAARGIHYLHTGLGGAVIHRDIKSTNILLDENYVAKVADFGLSTLSALDQSHVVTDIKGTFGYLDPEYFSSSSLTPKSDVYSFGVVLLEVLSARKVINSNLPREQVNLADWGVCCITRGEADKLVDPLLAGKITGDSLRMFGQIVHKCLQDYGADRPNMVDLLWDLEYALKLQLTARPGHPQENSDISYLALSGLTGLPSQSFVEYEEGIGLDESDTQINASSTNVSEVFS